VPEQELDAVRRYDADGELQVTAAVPNSAHPPLAGKLSFIDNTTDVATGTIRLRAAFANEDTALWPGQFVNVTVTLTSDPTAVVVPSLAVQNGQQGQYVFVVKPDQTVELRTVKVARANGNESVIQSGVKPGETVVTDGQLRLTPGSRISVKNAGGQKATS
jgi:multidrug efflux system membrane fusion protein